MDERLLLDSGLDLEAEYRVKLKRTVMGWGFTSTTCTMEALHAFMIPANFLLISYWA